jgi:arylsulfatase A-like enzyme
LIGIIAVCALGEISGRTFGGDGSKKPNVVVIYSDDQGWGDVGYHGCHDVFTPNIDALARNGVSFSQGYVSSSICMPSRVGVLTGVYQQRLGMDTNTAKGGIPTSQPTVFEMLKREGYQTAAIGKWNVGAEREEFSPNRRGVDFFYGSLWGSHDYYKSSTDPEDLRKWDSPIMRNTKIEPPIQDSNGYLTEMLTKETVSFIERADDDFSAADIVAQDEMRRRWMIDQLFSDPFASKIVPFDVWSFANMPPIIKF